MKTSTTTNYCNNDASYDLNSMFMSCSPSKSWNLAFYSSLNYTGIISAAPWQWFSLFPPPSLPSLCLFSPKSHLQFNEKHQRKPISNEVSCLLLHLVLFFPGSMPRLSWFLSSHDPYFAITSCFNSSNRTQVVEQRTCQERKVQRKIKMRGWNEKTIWKEILMHGWRGSCICSSDSSIYCHTILLSESSFSLVLCFLYLWLLSSLQYSSSI